MITVNTGVPNVNDAVSFIKTSGAKVWPLILQATGTSTSILSWQFTYHTMEDVSKIAGALNASGVSQGNFIVAGPDSMLTSSLFTAPGSQVFAVSHRGKKEQD